jgi:hypothetical protein
VGRQSHAEPAQRHLVPRAPRPLPADHLAVNYGHSRLCARCGQNWPCTFLTGLDQDAAPLPPDPDPGPDPRFWWLQ